ncbi:MAG: alpha/beta fold hydrolase [Planctomycetes bacterium]|nr:alpha/beta fold hydrolase [Planctomycetota bacterium]
MWRRTIAHGMLRSSTLVVLASTCTVLARSVLAQHVQAGHVVVEADQAIVYSDNFRTTARVSYPGDPPPLSGWPLIVLVPGLGSSHVSFAPEADAMADEGYLVVTYDVRGQASTKALNPGRGSRLWTLDEWIDLAEIIEWASERWPDTVDKSRIGVVGDSQGGIHAWAAAAYSGKLLPNNPRRTRAFPTISAVVPRIMAPQTIDVLVPDGTSFHELLGSWLADPKEEIIRFDATWRQTVEGYFDRDDPAGLRNWLRADPGRDFVQELATSTVPVLSVMSWLDEFLTPDRAIAALGTLPPTTPRRLLVSTGFHSTPLNTYQFILRQRMAMRWFETYLQRRHVGPDGGPPVITAAIPGDPVQYSLVQSIWRLREDSEYPAKDTEVLRLDLDAALKLRTANEDVFVGRRRITNVVNGSYDWRDFARDRTKLATVATALPVDKLEFVGAPLAVDLELAGDGTVTLPLTPTHADFQVGIRLFAQLPNGSRQLIATGGRAFQNASLATADYRIAFGCSTAVVAAGAQLVLEISNQVFQRPGDTDRFRLQPSFSAFAFDIDFPVFRKTCLELPIRAMPRVDLGTGIFDMEIDKPLPAEMFLQTSNARGGLPYLILLSLSEPSYSPIPGGRGFWFTRDAFTDFAFQFVTSPIFAGFVGVTDAFGVARPVLHLEQVPKLPNELRGLDMRVLPVLIPGPVVEAGATVSIRFQ